MEKQHEYSNGEVTVVWKPGKCIHAGECVKRLPQVYKPGQKPWIDASKGTAQELRDQIDQCPSGALSFIENEQ